MKVLVTGSQGYIGRAVVNYFYEKIPSIEVVEVDLKIGSRFEELKNESYDAIIHLAAFISVEESNVKKTDYITNNVINTVKLINNNRFKKFIFASTNAIFTPQGRIQPDSVYGATKLAIENYLVKELPQNSAIVRIANPIGLYHYHKSIIDQIDSETATVFYKLAMCKLTDTTFQIHNLPGMVRDFIDLEIVAELLARLCTDEKSMTGLFQIGSGISTKVVPLLVDACEHLEINHEFVPPPTGVDKGYIMDSSRSFEFLSHSPTGYNYKKILNDYTKIMS